MISVTASTSPEVRDTMDAMTNDRKPLSEEELKALPLYSDLHNQLVEVLIEQREHMDEQAIFALEDALLASLEPREHRKDFVELSMLSVGAPHLIRAVEKTWPHSRVFVSQFQNPESLGVSLDMVIHESLDGTPSLADAILDENGRVNLPQVGKCQQPTTPALTAVYSC